MNRRDTLIATKKKAKAPKKPRKSADKLTRCNGTMTEAQYLAWIRSALRSKSLRWPPRTEALERARRPYKGPNKQQKWEYLCAICGEHFKAKEVCVDHFPKPAGSILSVADIGEFCNNLYCEVDNLRVLCVEDHAVHTLAEKNGISFEEARVLRQINIICDWPKQKLLDYCMQHGYNAQQLSNAAKRKQAVTAILKGDK